MSVILALTIVGCSESYIAVNGYGKIDLNKDGRFYLTIFDCGSDSGTFQIKGDTLVMNTPIKPVNIQHTLKNKYKYTFDRSVLSVEVKDQKGCPLVSKSIEYSKEDSVVYIDDLILEKGGVLSVNSLNGPRACILDKDYEYAQINIDNRYGRKIYFDNFKFLIDGRYILPIDQSDIDKFRVINGGINVFAFRKSKKSFRVWKSGYGPVR